MNPDIIRYSASVDYLALPLHRKSRRGNRESEAGGDHRTDVGDAAAEDGAGEGGADPQAARG